MGCPPNAELVTDSDILAYLEENTLPFVQRDAAWLDFIAKSVGGSDAGMFKSKNAVRTVVNKKRRIVNMSGIIPCIWGTTFEPVGERVIELYFETTLRGSSQCIKGPYGSHYSPDGLCSVAGTFPADAVIGNGDGPANAFGWAGDADISGLRESRAKNAMFTALMEIKIPFSRVANGAIKSEYLAQVLMGLAIIPVRQGIFVDVNLRVCSLDDWDFDNVYFNNEFHNAYGSAAAWEHCPSLLGASGIYRKLHEADEFLDEKTEEVYSGPCDVGEFSEDDLSEVFRRISSGNLTIRHLDPVRRKRRFMMWDIIDGPCDDDRTLFGVLPWKVFDVYFAGVTRVPDFLTSKRDVLEEIQNQLATADYPEEPSYRDKLREEELESLMRAISV